MELLERGDPKSPLRRSRKSVSNSQVDLCRQVFQVGRTKTENILGSVSYSLQGNRKTKKGNDHSDRFAQFEHVARRVRACQRGGRPAVSVDTKKKEVLGKKPMLGGNFVPRAIPCVLTHTTFPTKN